MKVHHWVVAALIFSEPLTHIRLPLRGLEFLLSPDAIVRLKELIRLAQMSDSILIPA